MPGGGRHTQRRYLRRRNTIGRYWLRRGSWRCRGARRRREGRPGGCSGHRRRGRSRRCGGRHRRSRRLSRCRSRRRGGCSCGGGRRGRRRCGNSRGGRGRRWRRLNRWRRLARRCRRHARCRRLRLSRCGHRHRHDGEAPQPRQQRRPATAAAAWLLGGYFNHGHCASLRPAAATRGMLWDAHRIKAARGDIVMRHFEGDQGATHRRLARRPNGR